MLLQSLFWGSTLYLTYTFAGYPLLAALVARLHDRPWKRGTALPRVAYVVAAWNEAAVIGDKLRNAIALDYPRDRLQIVVVSDGSDDETVPRARAFECEGVRVLELPHGGKTAALNAAVREIECDILVLSDANVMLEPDALKKLVRHFEDPWIGGVSGDVRLRADGFTLGQSQGLYYRYERFIQTMESRFGSMIGADGGLYAMRRHLFQELPSALINDDFVLSMQLVRRGFRLVYDPEVVAWEDSPARAADELRRKIRVEQGNFQSLFGGWSDPGRDQPIEYWAWCSHKVLRWFGFAALSTLLGSSLALSSAGGIYALATGAQLTLYGAALWGATQEGKAPGLATVAHYFVLENYAAARGLARHFSGHVDWGKARADVRSPSTVSPSEAS